MKINKRNPNLKSTKKVVNSFEENKSCDIISL